MYTLFTVHSVKYLCDFFLHILYIVYYFSFPLPRHKHVVNWMIFLKLKKVAMKRKQNRIERTRQHVCSWWSCPHLPICYRPLLAEGPNDQKEQMTNSCQVLWVQYEGLKQKLNIHWSKFQKKNKEGKHTHTHTHMYNIKCESFTWLNCLQQQSSTFFMSWYT